MLASSTRMLRNAKRNVATRGGRKPLCARARTERIKPVPMIATSRRGHSHSMALALRFSG